MENKYLHIRISAELKQALNTYIKNEGLNVSAVVRNLIIRKLRKEGLVKEVK